MNDNKPSDIPFIVHEEALTRAERYAKRLWVLCIVIFCALVLTNAGWLLYEARYEDVVTVTQDVQTTESPAYVNGTGDMTINDEGETDNN